MRAARAGAVYFVVVFALGFVLGTLRVTLLAPAVGDLAAVAIEAPLMLAAAWVVCGVLISRMDPAPTAGERVRMGIVAFAGLISAEILLAATAFGVGPAAVAAGWLAPAGALGLAAQIVFALFPMIHTAGRPRPSI